MLCSLAAAYWRGDDTGERSMCLTFGLFFFVVAMAVLVIDESLLDFGLDKGKQCHVISYKAQGSQTCMKDANVFYLVPCDWLSETKHRGD